VTDPRSTALTLGLVAASYPIYRRLASGVSRPT
jgi:hypothetical protein